MDTRFDIEQTGNKQMPYLVPDDFFKKLEEDVMAEVHTEVNMKSTRRRRWYIGSAALTIAAGVALFLVLHLQKPETDAGDFAYVEQAFNQLNTEDQNYILDTYQNDVFINE